MPIDFTKPATSGNYSTGVLQPINDAMKALAQWLDPAVAGTLTSTPTGAFRLNAGAVERFNGTSWVAQSVNGVSLSAGKVGLGAATPNYNLGVNGAGADSYIQFTSTTTGSTTSDGFIVGSDTAGNAQLINRENTAMIFSVNNAEGMRLTTTGFGVGRTPAKKLDVAGDVRVGTNNTIDLREDATRGQLQLWEGSTRLKALTLGNFNGYGWLGMQSAEQLRLGTNNADRLILDASGHAYPGANATQDLGTTSRYWRSAYAMSARVGTDIRVDPSITFGVSRTDSGTSGAGLEFVLTTNEVQLQNYTAGAGYRALSLAGSRISFSTGAAGGALASESMRLESARLSFNGAPATTGDNAGRIQLLDGIFLGNVGTSAKNVLDWYEEGTFTPTVQGSTTAGACTYTRQAGQFTRIGNIVYYRMALIWTGHTGTGNLRLVGLPYLAANSTVMNAPSSGSASVMGVTFTGTPIGWVEPAANWVSMWLIASGSAGAYMAVPASGTVYVTGHYFV